jgi:hypothetical protein
VKGVFSQTPVSGNCTALFNSSFKKQMKQYLLLFMIMLFYVSCKNEKQHSKPTSERTVLKILVYGLPAMNYLHAANIVGKEYNIVHEIVGGCMVTQKFSDSIDRHNEGVYCQLKKEFGVNFEKDFDAKTDSMEFLISQVYDIINLKTDFRKNKTKFETKGIILSLWIEPTQNKGEFKAEAYETTLLSADSDLHVYFCWTVDSDTRKILKMDSVNCR